jgi:homeodomain-containing protein
MRQTELRLSRKDKQTVEEVRAKGLRHSREVNRAHILAALDRNVPQTQIMEVLGVERTAIWRTRAAYLTGGLNLALYDVPRPGRPRQYDTSVEARVTALACSAPPAGVKRWTVVRLAQAARAQPGLEAISRETIRRLLKKTASNHGVG